MGNSKNVYKSQFISKTLEIYSENPDLSQFFFFEM